MLDMSSTDDVMPGKQEEQSGELSIPRHSCEVKELWLQRGRLSALTCRQRNQRQRQRRARPAGTKYG